MLQDYLKSIFKIASQGDATEESYYPALKNLLEAFAGSSGYTKAHVTVLPKRTEAGNPDFRVWDGKQHIVGYIEAKAPAHENLEIIETSDQLKRYLHTFPNLILTNFFQFRLYRDGTFVGAVQIARPFTVYKLKAIPQVEKEKEFVDLLEKFFAFSLPKTYSAKALAVELAKRTRFLKIQILAELEREDAESKPGFTSGFYEAFQKYLIGSLSKDAFADLYAQTITYGLFAARTRAKNGFNRKLAFDFIPQTIGILRDVFRFISLEDPPQQMEWVIDDIAEVLAVTNIEAILKDRKGRDPIVHFYEPFLVEYDPKERERRGVYYTPEPVVSYIVRSLHRILKEVFGRTDGFASASVRVLDPAAGTCTFPAEAARQAADEFTAKYGEGGKAKLIPDHILKNFYAFELMMAPYAVGHLKIGYLLEELGHSLEKDERFQLYLTNTLDMQELQETKLPGMSSLAEESHLAGKVKKETPILAILGNPPYSGHSANRSEIRLDNPEIVEVRRTQRRKGKQIIVTSKKKVWLKKTFIGDLIDDYKYTDGKPLGEKNPKWLQDDYVKFIRFAQWKIEQTGEGVLGFITNHSYLDNPTFRGMRQSLMNTFEQIYLLDLHGNSLKKERCPDGSEDKNVFDIRQGVAIGLFVKKAGLERKVHHAELWGIREKKYNWLEQNDISTTQWTKIHPKSPSYFFVPRDEDLLERYQHYTKITDIFPVNSVGIVTARDNLTIRWTPNEVWSTVLNFGNLDPEMARQAYELGKDARDWKVQLAQEDLKSGGLDRKKVVPILYRPFDVRYTYYTGKSRGFHCMPRLDVMSHMLSENIALITPRRVEMAGGWQHTLVTKSLVEHVAVSLKTIDYTFPLYIYPGRGEQGLLKATQPTERTPNLSGDMVQTLQEVYHQKPSPEDIFYYIYAVLYAPTYRNKYAEFLKSDFPRIPFTKDEGLFTKLATLGKKLVDLHLLKSTDLDKPVCRFQGKANNRVEKQAYNQKERHVYINEAQYFEGVEPEVWSYQIGGYQVLDKWLKDRKKRILNLDDIKHYCRVVTALAKTMGVQAEIDALYTDAERETLSL